MTGAPIRLIYITVDSLEAATALARALLEERLIACANILPGATSLYWWQGRLCEESEVVLIAKTRADRVATLIDRVRALHSYDCPAVVSIPIDQGNPDFIQWIEESLSAPK